MQKAYKIPVNSTILVINTNCIIHLKSQLFAEKYQIWSDFKKRVLSPAITEISNNTDITVSYTTVKQGKRIVKLLFDVVVKTDIQERLKVAEKIESLLNPKEIKGQTMFKG